ncbi:hypothetical protein CO724_17280 [Ectopseudomonas mendocina]|nr:hypothetical protein CO724_17280 [Pseudomonas mendocina]
MKVIGAGQVAKPIVLGAAPRRTPVVVLAGLRGVPGTGGGGGGAGVSSFNGRTGVVSLTGSDVTTALAYTPADAASLSAVALSGNYSDLLGLPAFSAVALSGTYGDLSGKPFIPETPGDIGAATAEQGALADTAVQPAALSVQLDLKVDKVPGYGLSQENFTAAEKAKLAGLEGSHYRGTFINFTALQTALPTAEEGDYADVDAGAGAPVQRYIWDESDSEWVAQAGSADPITAAQVKALYESNPDTNAFTGADKSKLDGIASGATANPDTDSLAEGATRLYFTTARVLATVLSGLSLATGGAITSADTVLVAFGKLQRQINDLATAVSGKQDTLVSANNIKTINGSSLLGSGDLSISGSGADWGDIGGTLSDQTDLQAALNGKAAVPTVRTISGTSGTLVPSDAGNIVLCTSGSAVALSIQLEASGAWPAAAVVTVIQQGVGTVTISDGSGITVNVFSGLTKSLRGQYAPASLLRTAANTFTLAGTLGGTPA